MKKIYWVILMFWVTTISAVMTYFHSWHYVDLAPLNKEEIILSDKLPDVKNYGVVHYLTPGCSCSHHVFKHLNSRFAYSSLLAKESVVVIDDNELDFAAKLSNQNYNVIKTSTNKMSEGFTESIIGVPLLVIYDHNRVVKYVGGYSDSAVTPFTDVDISSYLNKIENGLEVKSNPVIGCSVSKEYQKLLDPFRLKYKKD